MAIRRRSFALSRRALARPPLLPSAAQMLVDVFLRRLRTAGRVMEQNSPGVPPRSFYLATAIGSTCRKCRREPAMKALTGVRGRSRSLIEQWGKTGIVGRLSPRRVLQPTLLLSGSARRVLSALLCAARFDTQHRDAVAL